MQGMLWVIILDKGGLFEEFLHVSGLGDALTMPENCFFVEGIDEEGANAAHR